MAGCQGYVYGKSEVRLGSLPLHGAKVTVIGPEVKTIDTTKEGKYDFSDIIAGDYKIYAEAEGYEPSEEKEFHADKIVDISFLLKEIPQKKFKEWRSSISFRSGKALWFATYAVFVFAVILAVASIIGFCIGTCDLFLGLSDSVSGMLGGSENISANSSTNNSTNLTQGVKQQGSDETAYVNLIKGAEHYLIAFTLLIISIGLHRIVSKGFQIELKGIEDLESMMIGLVVVTLAVVFLSKLFGEDGTITWEVGFSVSLIIIALSIFMFILKRKV
ncbi:MAG: carboxypeptidase regulatory-like domain-containing protein [Methanophagales archaeon]|nr:carboxypeptidase regulatory-like domain-containing protein [Methanophagales archaeon]